MEPDGKTRVFFDDDYPGRVSMHQMFPLDESPVSHAPLPEAEGQAINERVDVRGRPQMVPPQSPRGDHAIHLYHMQVVRPSWRAATFAVDMRGLGMNQHGLRMERVARTCELMLETRGLTIILRDPIEG